MSKNREPNYLNLKLVSFAILGVLVVSGYCLVLNYAHPFVLASPEARASVEVTEGQRDELLAARFSSDVLAFSLFGLLICAVLSIVNSSPKHFGHGVLSLLVGCVLGVGGGALAGLIGHALHNSQGLDSADPVVHLFVRLSAMLLPVAVAAGVTTAVACRSNSVITNAVMGSVIGAMLSALVYGILAGVVTPLETVSNIFPIHVQNRYLLFFSTFLAIGLINLIQAARSPRVPKSEASTVVG